MEQVAEIIINSPKYGEFKAMVDKSDFEIVSKFRWFVNKKSKNKFYPVAAIWTNGRPNTFCMHSLILPPIEGLEVDHSDGNPFNNKRNNLRQCTHGNNARNKKSNINKTGYKGVFIKSGIRKKPYSSIIMVNRKKISLGVYKTSLEAAIAYNEAALKYHGDFASLNVISPPLISNAKEVPMPIKDFINGANDDLSM